MKKIMLCAAAVAVLALGACSNKDAKNADSAAADSVNVTVAEEANVAVDSLNDSTAVVAETEQVVETVTPATDSTKTK